MTELSQARFDLLRVEIEAERKAGANPHRVQNACLWLGANAQAADARTQMVQKECRSARSEADVPADQRLQFGLGSQMKVESIRGKAVGSETRSAQQAQSLKSL